MDGLLCHKIPLIEAFQTSSTLVAHTCNLDNQPYRDNSQILIVRFLARFFLLKPTKMLELKCEVNNDKMMTHTHTIYQSL